MKKYLDLAIANEQIKTTDIKGKDYAEVNQRIKAFRMVYPQGIIETEMLSNENGICVFKASVGYREDGEIYKLATGTAYEKEDSSFINKTSYIENCETSAIGRALGIAGFGIDVSVASAEEVQNAINNQTVTQGDADTYTLTFGKYKGKTLKEIEEVDHKYINWIMDNTKDERLLKIIELSLGYAIPDEEEQTEILTRLNILNNLLNESDVDREKFYSHYKVKSNAEMTLEQINDAIDKLEKRQNNEN